MLLLLTLLYCVLSSQDGDVGGVWIILSNEHTRCCDRACHGVRDVLPVAAQKPEQMLPACRCCSWGRR
jgi:hypothetical protein